MQTPTNIQTAHIFIGKQARPHTNTHGPVTQTGLLWGPSPDCVECGSTPSVYFEGVVSQFQIPRLFLSLSVLLPSSRRGAAAVALRGHTVGSIITHTQGNYQVV